jgi:hypothetical protein
VSAVGRESGARQGSSPMATPMAWHQGCTSPEDLLQRRTEERRGLRLHAVEAPQAAVGGWRRQHLGGWRQRHGLGIEVGVGVGVGASDAPIAPHSAPYPLAAMMWAGPRLAFGLKVA